MARPEMNTVEYFPMYSHSSKTCEMLESKYGVIGYAFYYKLLQLLATENGHYYDARDPMSLEFLEQKLCNNEVSATEILDTLSKWGKLDQELWEKKVVWYQGFVDTLIPVYNKRVSELPNKEDVCKKLDILLGKNSVSDTETPPPPPIPGTKTPDNTMLPSRAVAKSTQSKVKESKVKEKEREREERKTPSLEEITNYCIENNYQTCPQAFFDKHEENGWLDKNGNPILHWQSRLGRFERKDFPDIKLIKVSQCKNNLKAIDLPTSQAQFDSWVSQLEINIEKGVAMIKPPSQLHKDALENQQHDCKIAIDDIKKALKVTAIEWDMAA